MFLNLVFALASALPDFLIPFGILSDFGELEVESETTLFETEAAWFKMKLVDCRRTEVAACEEENCQRSLKSGSSLEIIFSYSEIPSSDQITLLLLFSILGAVMFFDGSGWCGFFGRQGIEHKDKRRS